MPQDILYEVRGVLLQQHFIPLLEDFQHVVVQILVQGHSLVVLVLLVVHARVPREAGGIIVQDYTATSIAPAPTGLGSILLILV